MASDETIIHPAIYRRETTMVMSVEEPGARSMPDVTSERPARTAATRHSSESPNNWNWRRPKSPCMVERAVAADRTPIGPRRIELQLPARPNAPRHSRRPRAARRQCRRPRVLSHAAVGSSRIGTSVLTLADDDQLIRGEGFRSGTRSGGDHISAFGQIGNHGGARVRHRHVDQRVCIGRGERHLLHTEAAGAGQCGSNRCRPGCRAHECRYRASCRPRR